MDQEQDDRRALKTLNQMRRGGFQPPAQDVADRTIRVMCDGCGETIDAAEQIYAVTIAGVFDVQLHAACYGAWLDFRP
jgi:hypothetical protein